MKDVFFTLLNMSISALWLIAAVVLVRLFSGKAPKWIRGVLWAMVAVRLILPFAIESPLSLVPQVEVSYAEADDQRVDPEQYQSEATGGGVQSAPTAAPVAPTGAPSVPEPTGEPIITPQVSENTAPAVSEGAGSAQGNGAGAPSPGPDWALVGTVVWLVGMVAMAGYCVLSYLWLKRKLIGAVRAEDGVYESERIDSAFVLGFVRPLVYLPRFLPACEREYVISHEKAHISRFDYILKPLGFLVLALHWFNPAVWLAYVLYCRDIELACDERVIKGYTTEQVKGYSNALVSCGEGHVGMLVCPIAFGEIGVKERVKNILNYKKPAFWIIIGAVVLCVIVAVCFMTVRSRSEAPTDPQSSDTGTAEGDGGEEEPTAPTDETASPTEEEPTDTTAPTEGEEIPSYTSNYTFELGEYAPIGNYGDYVTAARGTDIYFGGSVLNSMDEYMGSQIYGGKAGDDILHIMPFIVESTSELSRALSTLVFSDGYSVSQVTEFEKYDDAYFEDKAAIIMVMPLNSNRIYEYANMWVDDAKLNVELCIRVSLAQQNEAVEYRCVLYEFDKATLDGVDTVSIFTKRYNTNSLPMVLYDTDISVEEIFASWKNRYTFKGADNAPSGIEIDFTDVQINRSLYDVSDLYEEYFTWVTTKVADAYNAVDDTCKVGIAVFDDTEKFIWGFGGRLYDQLQKYDPDFFENNALIALYRTFSDSGGKLDFSVGSVCKDGDQLNIGIYTELYRNGQFYPHGQTEQDTYQIELRFIEVPATSLDGVETISLYAEDIIDLSEPPCGGVIDEVYWPDQDNTDCEHEFEEYGDHATCKKGATVYKRCIYCNYGYYEDIPASDHKMMEATCKSPSWCMWCGYTEGDYADHTFPEKCSNLPCSVCRAKNDAPADHEYVNNVCVVCWSALPYVDERDTYTNCTERVTIGDGDMISLMDKYDVVLRNDTPMVAVGFDMMYYGKDNFCPAEWNDMSVVDAQGNELHLHSAFGYDEKLYDIPEAGNGLMQGYVYIPFTGWGEYLIDLGFCMYSKDNHGMINSQSYTMTFSVLITPKTIGEGMELLPSEYTDDIDKQW